MFGIGMGAVRALVAVALVTATVTAAQAAGALAVGTCAAYGSAHGFGAMEAARTAALGKCSGKGCKVVATMHRNCAAFAVDGRNPCGAFGYSTAPRLGQAGNVALRYCYQNGGRDCMIRTWACDRAG